MKLPAFQFYPADWRKDIGVQSLSYHDRGVWFEILCLMHESEQRGKLLLNGKPMPNEVLSRLLGLDKQGLDQALGRIKAVGVASVDEDGALMNRRMVKDERIRQIRREAGEKGGNPNLLNQKGNQNGSKPPSKNKPLHSSSSSSPSEKKKETTNVVSKKGSRISADFQPSEKMIEWARKEASAVGLATETQKFKNYWESKAGSGATKLDWDKTWQNWIINARDSFGNNGNKANWAQVGKSIPDEPIAPKAEMSETEMTEEAKHLFAIFVEFGNGDESGLSHHSRRYKPEHWKRILEIYGKLKNDRGNSSKG